MGRNSDLAEDMQTLRNDLFRLRSDISDITQRFLGEDLNGEGNLNLSRLQTKFHNAYDSLSDSLRHTRVRGRIAARNAREVVKERPYTSMGLLLASAFMLGRYFYKRS